ncbi:MFS transporter [Nostoc sp.]|uniref:MFS transporter n=1 Tax=Nostoc sp. TaxID=1180 RepID=UPI002FF37C42
MLSLTRYQWTVFFAAWLGWGFDLFDSLLFSYVAPNCVPTLLGLPIGSSEAKAATLFWTGLLTSILLLGWAAGGIVFGTLADRIGRSKTMMLTILCFSLGTATCAVAPNIAVLILSRVIASLGLGGEWAAGASLVAEVMPERSRVEAGALLYTSAPVGLTLATLVNLLVAGVLFKNNPEVSWRFVFLFGLLPGVVAFLLRYFVKEPESWRKEASNTPAPSIQELFNHKNFPQTRCGFLTATVALLTWWTCNGFIPVISAGLAQTAALTQGLDKVATQALIEQWKTIASNSFNLGGLIGTLLTVPLAKYWGRRKMLFLYFLLSGLALIVTFRLNWSPYTRLYLYFPIGLTVFGVFGSFTYYLPELFPTRLRATGVGFCYNVGRLIAAGGPFLVGAIASSGSNVLHSALELQLALAVVPLIGLFCMPWVIETRAIKS